jgi:hypothetical protein
MSSSTLFKNSKLNMLAIMSLMFNVFSSLFIHETKLKTNDDSKLTHTHRHAYIHETRVVYDDKEDNDLDELNVERVEGLTEHATINGRYFVQLTCQCTRSRWAIKHDEERKKA